MLRKCVLAISPGSPCLAVTVQLRGHHSAYPVPSPSLVSACIGRPHHTARVLHSTALFTSPPCAEVFNDISFPPTQHPYLLVLHPKLPMLQGQPLPIPAIAWLSGLSSLELSRENLKIRPYFKKCISASGRGRTWTSLYFKQLSR